MLFISILLLVCNLFVVVHSSWLTKQAARSIIDEFKQAESAREEKPWRGHDRRPATPFISGDAFRNLCAPHICEDANRCRMEPENVSNGSCVFIKSDLFDMFMTHIAPQIKGTYVTVSHNGDLSTPDGQTDAPRIGMPKYEGMTRVMEQHRAGRLLAHHGQNLWWRNSTVEAGSQPRPPFLHCLPIGMEIRQYKVGSKPEAYADALQAHIVDAPEMSLEQLSLRPLLMIAFWPKSRVPDREKVLRYLGILSEPRPTNPFYNYTDCDHAQWLQGITMHKFVLAPFGHGLDTHRVYEILLMGGIPVMRKSSITSCFDDTDNYMGTISSTSHGGNTDNNKRGSLPIVVLNSWEELTKERLDKEWDRISAIPPERWDHTRLLFNHWADRVTNLKHQYGANNYADSFGAAGASKV